MDSLSDHIDEILSLTYYIHKLKKTLENDIFIKKLFINQLKNLYYELDKFDVESFIENDTGFTKYSIIKLCTVLDSFSIPHHGDFLTHIYNKSDFSISFGIYINSIKICEYNLEPKQIINPIFSISILPMYLINGSINIIFYDTIKDHEKRKLAFIYRDIDEPNRKFLRLFSHHINYYTIQNNNSFIIEHGRLNMYNITGLDMNKYLYENDACFDRSITKFCIEI